MALLDLVLQHSSKLGFADNEFSRKTPSSLFPSKSSKFTSEVARKALNLMIILRPVTMVTTVAKEVSSYLASQHVTHYPHSSIQPVQVSFRHLSTLTHNPRPPPTFSPLSPLL